MANSGNDHQSNMDAALLALGLDRGSGRPLHGQLAEALRALVLTGRFGGSRLPASRILAIELGVSRMTVTTAYEQLIAEGYLAARRGDGTYVAQHLPHLAAPAPRTAPRKAADGTIRPFHPGMPDQRAFPHRLWARQAGRAPSRSKPARGRRIDRIERPCALIG